MVVLNKAANMVVHSAAGNWDGTVANAVAYDLQRNRKQSLWNTQKEETGKNDESSSNSSSSSAVPPGIVHCLDKGITGELVVAKNNQAAFLEQFANRHTVSKMYLCISGKLWTMHCH
jgi:23S rRNA pseudouridine1911/1915/1917 synthase